MKSCSTVRPLAALALLTLSLAASGASDQINHGGMACAATEDYFRDSVWPKVASQKCIECHKPGGEADDSHLVLQDPARDTDPTHATSLEHNRAAFAKMAAIRKNSESRLLLKVRGELHHGGEDVLKPDSTGYRVLAEFVRRESGEQTKSPSTPSAASAARDFFAGVQMVDDRQLLRRLTLSLAGRLPKADELAKIQSGGVQALGPVLDAVMHEEAFYDRLAEAFNDILLVRGYGDGAESALSYENFSKTRLWTQKFDLTSAGDESAQRKARYKLDADYREALLREPLELIKYIVRENRPFTEVVTADYIMESPYTARGYGNFDEVSARFHNVEDPFEYIPVRLTALKSRQGPKHDQPSETGFYPHAGLLSSFQYLRRYPTTETNRNRLRSRMYYQHFLGVDVLELAARVTDAAAVQSKFEVPTMQAAECVVCHRTLDPVAGIFQDFYSFEGVYGPRKDGWYTDMFQPGFEGEDLPPPQKWRSMQWLGERTIKDPRFARTMVEHAYYLLTGRKVLLAPKGIDDPLYDARQRAFQAQRREVEAITAKFVQANFDFREAVKGWAVSPFYRADALASAEVDSERRVELADLGLQRLLSPEQLERKVEAIFGQKWGRFKDSQASILYGGIDSKEVTERAPDPSGGMGALQRTMANDVACKNVALDFSRPADARRLFPGIEPDDLPGESAETDQRLRGAVAHLHEVVLGRFEREGSPEIERTYELFTGILEDAHERKGLSEQENYSCRAGGERLRDPKYTIRAWRGVVTYLLRQREFLYE